MNTIKLNSLSEALVAVAYLACKGEPFSIHIDALTSPGHAVLTCPGWLTSDIENFIANRKKS